VKQTWTQVMSELRRWCNSGNADQKIDRQWLFIAELSKLAGVPTDSEHDIWAANSLVFRMFDKDRIQKALVLAKKNIKAYRSGDYKPETFVM
jgi:hypothetical protein